MADHGITPQELRSRYKEELRDTCRSSVLLIGTLTLVIYPLWAIVDRLLEPENARHFLSVRLFTLIPIAALYFWVVLRPSAVSLCYAIGFVNLTLTEVSIAWMIPYCRHALDIYLLGFTLPIFGGALLVRWRRALIFTFFGVTFGSLLLFFLLAHYPWTTDTAIRVVFYLGSSFVIGLAAWLFRYSAGMAEFETRDALLRERRRADDLAMEMSRLSLLDALTGLANRRLWDEASARIFAVTRRGNLPLSILLIDIDWFKRINDRFGHVAGDAALKAVSRLIARRSRSTDVAARIGGDELAILLPAAGEMGAMTIAEELRAAAALLQFDEYPEMKLTLSVGVAVVNEEDVTILDLMKRADVQLYQAKRTRNSVSMATRGE